MPIDGTLTLWLDDMIMFGVFIVFMISIIPVWTFDCLQYPISDLFLANDFGFFKRTRRRHSCESFELYSISGKL